LRNTLSLLLFVLSLTGLLIGGGALLRHVSQNPIIVDTTEDIPTTEPEINVPLKTEERPIESPDIEELAQQRKETETQLRELSDGKAEHREVLPVDPKSKNAREPQNRVRQGISENTFKHHLTSGMAALHDGNYYVAQDEFIKAKAIRPNAPELKDALAQVDGAIRLKLIEDLHKEAVMAERSEKWEQASDSYLAVLKIDETLQFALQGKARSLDRLRTDRRLQYYLDQPGVLESDKFLNKAIRLVERAEAIEPKGPRLHSQIENLRQRIQIAQTPVKVIIESDNLTDVAVYRVGKFGKFRVKELNLRPGSYIVVGVRDGYKDVRENVVVKAQDRQLRIRIACAEKI
jgi:hypothetical protein